MNDGSPVEKLYWPQLDGLRTLAFLLVYLSHLPSLPSGEEETAGNFAVRFINCGMQWGWIGVELFFTLSAFLITTLLLKERKRYAEVSFRQFFIRRVLRIWPLYFAFIVLAFGLLPLLGFLGFVLGSPPWQAMVNDCLLPYLCFLTNFCFISPSVPAFPLYARIPWSVAMEEQFYITWGMVLSRCRQVSSLWLIVLTALPVTIMVRWAIQTTAWSHNAYYYNTFSHLDAILTGIAAALLLFQKREHLERLFRKWGAFFFMTPAAFYIYLILFVPKIQENDVSIVPYFSLIAVASTMFLLAVLAWPPASRFFSPSWLVRFGRLTYGTYMFHLLGLVLASQFCGSIFRKQPLLTCWFALAVTGLLFTWLISLASWHFLEKRFYNQRYQFARVPSGFGVQEAPAVAAYECAS